jgi:hypothetical protein
VNLKLVVGGDDGPVVGCRAVPQVPDGEVGVHCGAVRKRVVVDEEVRGVCGVHGPDPLVPYPNKVEVRGGDDLREGRKVLATHARRHGGPDGARAHRLGGDGLEVHVQRGGVHCRGQQGAPTGAEVHGRGASVHRGLRNDHLLDATLQPHEAIAGEAPKRAADRHGVRDHVERAAALEPRHCYHLRVQRVRLPRDEALQAEDDAGGCHHGVDDVVGGGGVATGPGDHRLEEPAPGQQRAGPRAHHAGREHYGDVEPEYGLDVLHGARLHHLLGANADLLSRLEKEDYCALREREKYSNLWLYQLLAFLAHRENCIEQRKNVSTILVTSSCIHY